MSPTSLDPTRPIPRILNKSLCFILDLEGRDAFGRACRHAIVQAPRTLPRLIRLPSDLPDVGPSDFVFLSSVIEEFVSELFPGVKIKGCHQFRVTRNSDLYVDDEEISDLVRALEGLKIPSIAPLAEDVRRTTIKEAITLDWGINRMKNGFELTLRLPLSHMLHFKPFLHALSGQAN